MAQAGRRYGLSELHALICCLGNRGVDGGCRDSPCDDVSHKGRDDRGDVQGEEAVAEQAHGLEEADVAPQEVGVDGQDDGPGCAHAKHQLRTSG